MPRKSIVASSAPELLKFMEIKKPNLQDNRLKLINEIFDMWDLDGDNKIKANQGRQILIAMGREPTNENILNFLQIADPDNTGVIEKDNFMNALFNVYSIPDEDVDKVIDAFSFFDKKNNGKINENDLTNILENNDFDKNDISRVLRLIQPDALGNFDYDDFVRNWKFQ